MRLTRQCTKCKRVLSVSMFNQNKTCKDGLYTRCKDCKADENRIHAINRKERERAKALAERAAREADAMKPIPNVAMPRTFSHIKDAPWDGKLEPMYVRNSGNKHIPSRGL